MLQINDKFKLVDLDNDDLKNINYDLDDIDYIFEFLEEVGYFVVTKVTEGPRGPDYSKIYYYNENVGGECCFYNWMCESLEKQTNKIRGHCLTKIFKPDELVSKS